VEIHSAQPALTRIKLQPKTRVVLPTLVNNSVINRRRIPRI
jgi:hypothetical protein